MKKNKILIYLFAIFNFIACLEIIKLLFDASGFSFYFFPTVLLAALYLMAAVGYIRQKYWSWYLTFPQIVLSLLSASTSFSIMLLFFREQNELVVNACLMLLEVCKGILFFRSSIQNSLGRKMASPLDLLKYKRIMFLLFGVIILYITIILSISLSRFYS